MKDDTFRATLLKSDVLRACNLKRRCFSCHALNRDDIRFIFKDDTLRAHLCFPAPTNAITKILYKLELAFGLLELSRYNILAKQFG